jgi:hypothetical protein
MPDWIAEAITLYTRCESWGIPPVAGGYGDQPAFTLAVIDVIHEEVGRARSAYQDEQMRKAKR